MLIFFCFLITNFKRKLMLSRYKTKIQSYLALFEMMDWLMLRIMSGFKNVFAPCASRPAFLSCGQNSSRLLSTPALQTKGPDTQPETNKWLLYTYPHPQYNAKQICCLQHTVSLITFCINLINKNMLGRCCGSVQQLVVAVAN